MTDMFVADYAQLSIHRLMVADPVRMKAYHKAIGAAVKPGDVVLDVGAGTGVMGMLAAQAGARKVYSVEKTSIAEMARKLVKANGLEDTVEVIRGDAAEVELPEQVDLIVGEWMGCYGVDENLLTPVLVTRDRWLRPGGKMLPEIVTAWLAPADDFEFTETLNFWRSKPYGLDFGPVAVDTANQVRVGEHDIEAEHLRAEPARLWTTDVRAMSVEESRSAFHAEIRFVGSRRGAVSALAAWFTADFPDGTVLTNAPDAPVTHWGRSVFPLDDRLAVDEGTPIEVQLTCEPAEPGYCHQKWSVRVGSEPWEHHDSRWDPTLDDVRSG